MTNIKNVILTVQPCGRVVEKCKGKYRLGINCFDSANIFKTKFLKVFVEVDGEIIETKTTCGTTNKKGFDLSDIKLDNWIKKNNFCDYLKRHPTKLRFTIVEKKIDYIKIKFP